MIHNILYLHRKFDEKKLICCHLPVGIFFLTEIWKWLLKLIMYLLCPRLQWTLISLLLDPPMFGYIFPPKIWICDHRYLWQYQLQIELTGQYFDLWSPILYRPVKTREIKYWIHFTKKKYFFGNILYLYFGLTKGFHHHLRVNTEKFPNNFSSFLEKLKL